jgi:hypothetical protein
MRRPRQTLAIACATLALAGGSAATAVAATSAHLTPGAWRVLSANRKVENATVSQCNALAGNSADQQVRGIAGMCVDGAQFSQWWDRENSDCRGNATRSQCLRDLNGAVADLNAAAAWAGWFTGQLAGGGCRSFFATVQHDFVEMASATAPLAADIRQHRSQQQYASDATRLFGKLFEISADQGSPAAQADRQACRPS